MLTPGGLINQTLHANALMSLQIRRKYAILGRLRRLLPFRQASIIARQSVQLEKTYVFNEIAMFCLFFVFFFVHGKGQIVVVLDIICSFGFLVELLYLGLLSHITNYFDTKFTT